MTPKERATAAWQCLAGGPCADDSVQHMHIVKAIRAAERAAYRRGAEAMRGRVEAGLLSLPLAASDQAAVLIDFVKSEAVSMVRALPPEPPEGGGQPVPLGSSEATAEEKAPDAPPPCDHGVTFDQAEADRLKLNSVQIRKRWPRLFGVCPKGCGYNGIAYASMAHYLYGDW